MKDLLDNEIWKDIQGFEGRYQVSNMGRVKSLSRVTQLNGRARTEPEVVMAFTYRSGYPTLILRKDGKRYSRQVHRLVADAFVPNPNNYPIVNHKDFSRDNNEASNLEWCTQQHNVRWSAHNMWHPRENTRPTNTGYKSISKTKDGTFRVCIYHARKVTTNEFKTLERAIKWRNETWQKMNLA